MVYGQPPNTLIVLCVSSLRSLMLDQTKQFSEKGLSVDYVGSSEEQAHARVVSAGVHESRDFVVQLTLERAVEN